MLRILACCYGNAKMMIVHHNLAYGFIFELFDQYINAYVDYSKTLRALSNLNVK